MTRSCTVSGRKIFHLASFLNSNVTASNTAAGTLAPQSTPKIGLITLAPQSAPHRSDTEGAPDDAVAAVLGQSDAPPAPSSLLL